MAGLNFPDNCDFRDPASDKTNIASFELIPYILSDCATAEDAKKKLIEIFVHHCLSLS